jgi:hypothetical protein
MLRVKGSELDKMKFARDAVKAVLEDREEMMVAMQMEMGRLRVKI